jgi:hypothetical protein
MSEAEQVVERPGVTVVTSENFDEYVAKQLPPVADISDAEIIEDTPEAKAAEELKKVEKEKAERKAADEEIDHPDKEKKGKLNERFSELTAKRKAAEEAATKAAADAKEAREAADKARQEADALRMKYEPPKSDEIGPEPQIADYGGDPVKFAADLKEWTANKVRIEDKQAKAEAEARQANEAIAKGWMERQTAYKAENPEYEAKIVASEVKVSDEVRDAIIESDVGPQLLLHLAENPDYAKDLGKLTVKKALKELGRLEERLSGDKPAAAPTKALAEISKAPAPITPIKNASAPVLRLAGHNEVPKEMNYEQWKKLREAGKIA